MIINRAKNIFLIKAITLFFFLQIITISESKSQSDFRPGYVITNQMDTIYGLVDYRGEIRNSKMCVFKTDESVEPITYLPGEINSYRFIDSKYYISKVINSEPVFMEYLVNGLVDLFFIKNNDLEQYYLEKDNRLIPLTNETKEIEIEGKGKYLKESNQYIGYLKASFADCMEIQPKLEKARLNHESLTDLTVEYHNLVCTDGACIVYQKPKPLYRIRFVPMLGMEISKFKWNNIDYNTSIQPNIGFVLINMMPRINEKFSFNLEANFSKPSLYGYYSDGTSSYSNYYYLKWEGIVMKLNGSLNYEYPKGKIRPTVAVGVGIQYFEKTPFKVRQDIDDSNEIRTEEYTVPGPDEVYSFYNINLGANYYLNKKITIYSSLSYNTSSIYSAININFGIFL